MRAVVDRIEGEIAVLEVDGARFADVPLSSLPVGTRQGDVLVRADACGGWTRDEASRERRERAVSDLMKRLFR